MKNMKMIAIICSLTLSASSLQAGSCSSDKDESDKAIERRRMMQEKREKRSQNMNEQKMSGEWGTHMPASHGCASNEGFVFSMEYLLMRAYQPNLAYAFERKAILENTVIQVGSTSVRGNMVRPVRTWRPGFKVGLGWNTPYDLWDVQSEWMYYYNKSCTNKSTDSMILSAFANNNEGFMPYWVLPVINSGGTPTAVDTDSFPGGATYTQLQGVWQMNYNMINLELGRSLYLTKALAIRPHFGLQNGWIHQKVNVEYARSLNVQPVAANNNTRPLDQRATLTSKFWGVGIRTGFGGEWQLGAGFSVMGKLAGSLLSGRTNSRRVQDSAANATLGGIGTSSFTRVVNVSDRVREFSPGLDTSLGINWGTCMGCDDSMYFGLSLNWESIYWWGQFRFLQPNAVAPANSATLAQSLRDNYPFQDNALNIEGFTAKAKFDF